jgi:undecaprenyl-diphosphatase
VTRWFATHRTPVLNDVTWWWSKAGDTHAILLVSLVACPLMVALIRRWRPVLFLALTMFGELTLFLVSARAVDRPRPPVEHLDGKLPTAAFPSGHIAATMCLYGAIALIVMPRTDRWWRWLTVVLAVVMPIGVAVSRIYRGMHHPTDVIGALILTLTWVTLLYYVVRPNADVRTAGARGEDADAGDDLQHPERRRAAVTGDRRGDHEAPTGSAGTAGAEPVRS